MFLQSQTTLALQKRHLFETKRNYQVFFTQPVFIIGIRGRLSSLKIPVAEKTVHPEVVGDYALKTRPHLSPPGHRGWRGLSALRPQRDVILGRGPRLI